MTWRESLRKASFRGVEFLVETVETEGGRRIVVHKYPQRDNIYAEDLGLDADTFTIRAFLLGDDYITQRDALLRELKKKGTGTLVLPSQGSKKVVPQPYRLGYDSREGGIEYIDLSFVEAGENSFPSQSIDTASKVAASADKATETVKAVFQTQFKVGGYQDFVSNSAQSLGHGLADTVSAATSLRPNTPEQASTLGATINAFREGVSGLVLNPSDFSEAVMGMLGPLMEVYPLAQDAYLAYQFIFSFANKLPVTANNTRNQQQQFVNQNAFAALTRQASLIGMARASANIEFDSYDDAVALRDSLAGLIDDEIYAIGDTDQDDVFQDLGALRADVIADITSRAANLERIRTVTLQQSLPSLVMSYSLYETTDRSEELVKRNKIEHPGFMPAGQPLQILV